MSLSAHHQAILLLTAYLPGSRKDGVRPLSTTEWNQVAVHLSGKQMDPESLMEPDGLEALSDLGVQSISMERLQGLMSRSMALGMSLQKWLASGMWILSRKDERYPSAYKTKLGRQSPPILFGFGDASLLNSELIAVVGSRNADPRDLEITSKLAHVASDTGLGVLSGAARGVDETAMIAALDHGGFSVGVASDSLLRLASSAKYRKWLQSGALALVSPFNPEARFDVGNAMSRNKMVYALSKMTFIIASDAGKGGTWAGAVENLRHQWAPSYVLKYDPVKDGNAQLIQKGCSPFTEQMLTAQLFEASPQPEVAFQTELVQDKGGNNSYGEQLGFELK
jgi:predicted Rossmann fold nucleotide-binding protein DprA/Smf involved in DNA uptake